MILEDAVVEDQPILSTIGRPPVRNSLRLELGHFCFCQVGIGTDDIKVRSGKKVITTNHI